MCTHLTAVERGGIRHIVTPATERGQATGESSTTVRDTEGVGISQSVGSQSASQLEILWVFDITVVGESGSMSAFRVVTEGLRRSMTDEG